jgi:hypothetical protein
VDQHESAGQGADAERAELQALRAERAEMIEELRKMGFYKDTGESRELLHALRNVLNDFTILREVVKARRGLPR